MLWHPAHSGHALWPKEGHLLCFPFCALTFRRDILIVLVLPLCVLLFPGSASEDLPSLCQMRRHSVATITSAPPMTSVKADWSLLGGPGHVTGGRGSPGLSRARGAFLGGGHSAAAAAAAPPGQEWRSARRDRTLYFFCHGHTSQGTCTFTFTRHPS